MEPLLDPLQAIEPDAPLLHPNVSGYRGLLHPIETPSNVFVDMNWKKGDVEAGFRESDIVVENIFTTKPVHQAYIEPHACVVQAQGRASMPISGPARRCRSRCANKSPRRLAKASSSFTVHPCYIGGCFGGKGDFMDVPVCYLLSLKSGRPVKMVMDYSEEFVAGNPRHAAIVRVKTGVNKDGRLVAHQMEYVFDSGAYGAFKPQGYLVGPKEAAGPYRIPNVFIRGADRLHQQNSLRTYARAGRSPGFFRQRIADGSYRQAARHGSGGFQAKEFAARR